MDYHGEVEIRCHPGGGCSVVVHSIFDFRLSEDEAAEQMRELWAKHITPRQKGLPLPPERKTCRIVKGTGS